MAGKKKSKKEIQKKKNEKKQQQILLPGFEDTPQSVRKYLARAGLFNRQNALPDTSLKFWIGKSAFEPFPWEMLDASELLSLFSLSLQNLSENCRFFGKSILVYGTYAILYGGWLASLKPEAEITAVSLNPQTDALILASLPYSIRQKIRPVTLEEAALEKYETLLTSDLGNVWLSGYKADQFYTTDALSEKLSAQIASPLEQLISLIKPNGTFAFLHQNAGDAPFFAWMRGILPLMKTRIGAEILLPADEMNLEDVSVLNVYRVGENPGCREISNAEDVFKQYQREIAALYRQICLTASNPYCEISFSDNTGTIARWITEHTGVQTIRTIELSIEVKEEKQTIRIMVCYMPQKHRYSLVSWSLPDDVYEENYLENVSLDQMLQIQEAVVKGLKKQWPVLSEPVVIEDVSMDQ